MLARIPLVPLALLTTVLSLVIAVFMIVGAPMAGTAGALAAMIGAVALTIPMALIFSHGPPAGH
ncbi:MAG: hypothetical protein ACXVCV_10460 [Polyangia bacterium]